MLSSRKRSQKYIQRCKNIYFLFLFLFLSIPLICLIKQGLLDEWTSKDPAVKDLNSKGSELCSLMTFLTSPAKSKTPNKPGKHRHTYPHVFDSFGGMGSMVFGLTSQYSLTIRDHGKFLCQQS